MALGPGEFMPGTGERGQQVLEQGGDRPGRGREFLSAVAGFVVERVIPLVAGSLITLHAANSKYEYTEDGVRVEVENDENGLKVSIGEDKRNKKKN